MHPASLIAVKRDGGTLSRAQIEFLIAGYVAGSIPDYQMSAFAMAVMWRGMNDEETAALTMAMLSSGTTLKWPAGSAVVDKHSTGGIGDKTSLILAPLLAACGLRVPMLSGRGLGPTGGTLDKLESIPGFRTDLSIVELQAVVERVGCVITGTTPELVPADRRLYALRDVTGTVPSIPLITASIMSKKLAESPQALVLDVKWGSGAFMKTLPEARALAGSLVRIGRLMNVPVTALLTDMNQPLGRMCGNAVEVRESLDCLRGSGPADLRQCVLELGIAALLACNRCPSRETALELLMEKLDGGEALARFERMVEAQGGGLADLCSIAPASDVNASRTGVIGAINAEALGLAIIELGGGRRIAGETIDHRTGLEVLVRIGDRVTAGQPLVRVFADSPSPSVLTQIESAVKIAGETTTAPVLIVEQLTSHP